MKLTRGMEMNVKKRVLCLKKRDLETTGDKEKI